MPGAAHNAGLNVLPRAGTACGSTGSGTARWKRTLRESANTRLPNKPEHRATTPTLQAPAIATCDTFRWPCPTCTKKQANGEPPRRTRAVWHGEQHELCRRAWLRHERPRPPPENASRTFEMRGVVRLAGAWPPGLGVALVDVRYCGPVRLTSLDPVLELPTCRVTSGVNLERIADCLPRVETHF